MTCQRVRRRQEWRGGLQFESLEPRLALDSALGVGAASLIVSAGDASSSGTALASAEAESSPFSAFASEEELRQYLVDAALTRWEGLFGQPAWGGWWRTGIDYVLDSAPGEIVVNSAGEFYSGTNIQVDGVEEGDLVKTDGDYLYYLANGELTIVDIRNPASMRIASRLSLESQAWPREMYLIGDRLTLISQSYRQAAEEPGPGGDPANRDELWLARSGMPGHWTPFEAIVQVSVYDIADRAAPQPIQTAEIDGQLLESPSDRGVGDRRAAGRHRTAASRDALRDGFRRRCQRRDLAGRRGGLRGSRRTRCRFAGRSNRNPLAVAAREVRVRDEGGVFGTSAGPGGGPLSSQHSDFGWKRRLLAEGRLHEAQDISRPELSKVTNLVSVVLFDVADLQAEPTASSASFMDFVTEIYVTADSLYVAAAVWGGEADETSIHRFGFSDTQIELTAVGQVPGRPLNQFALDEYAGYLRIATTQGWGSAATSGLYVLREENGRLATVGKVEGLAAGETIFAARFFGETAFLVTFRRVDPLFAIDLRDPAAPSVAGELKIPGFSHYLHPIQDGFLIGLGRDADEATGQQGQPQLSLFNVDDLAEPELVDQFLIELGGWGFSDAFFDHHAIGYFPSHEVLVLPFQESGWFH